MNCNLHDGVNEDEDLRLIRSLRCLLQNAHKFRDEDADDATLRRFLRARSMNVEKAHKFLLRHLQWKREFMPEGSISASEIQNELKQEKFFLQGIDKCGHPIGVALANRHYVSSTQDLEELKKFVVYALDKALLSLPEGQEKLVLISDMTGYSYRNVDVQGSCAILEIMQEHYPERLAKCYVLHAPYIFWGLWKILTAFMDPTVKEKVVFVEDKHVKSTLLKDIDESQLPDIFGGKLPLKPIE